MCFWLFNKNSITAQATPRDTRVGMATPSTPRWKTKIKSAFPETLMAFIKSEVFMAILELPMERKMAAPAL